MTGGGALRSIGVAIAVAGAIDPSFSSVRSDKPVVSLLASSARDETAAARAAGVLERHFTVVRTADAGASAVVLVGDRVPDGIEVDQKPAFALASDAGVMIERVDAPSRADLASRVPIAFAARVPAGTTSAEARLRVNGVVVDRLTMKVSGEGGVAGALTFAPTSAGPVHLQIEVTAASASASVDAATDVQPIRWTVLSYDPRPSWASTFVRRTLEDDPRFVVTARVATSPKTTAETGQAPGSLDASLDGFNVVVVGAPDSLTAGDVARLDAFARRGGSVCLILDRVASGPYEQLAGTNGWTARQLAMPAAVDGASGRLGSLHATEFAIPNLKPGAVALASESGHPIVWRSPAGAGAVYVSGALDAWRRRAAEHAGFDRFWQTLIADAAASARGPIDLQLDQRIVASGAPISMRVALGDSVLALTSTSRLTGRIEGPGGAEPLRFWPERPGIFVASAVAPRTPGVYSIVVSGGVGEAAGASHEVRAALLVADSVSWPADRSLVAAWAGAHGGAAFPSARVDDLDRALVHAVRPPVRPAEAFPMRSPYWLLPFALALSGEWWLRRRRGLA